MNNKEITRQDIVETAALLGGQPCILFGAASLLFYGVGRGTRDIDIEIPGASLEQIEDINLNLKRRGIKADVTGNSSGWGMIPLPEGYRDRVNPTDIQGVYILDAPDFVLSKLRRGTEKDVNDCLLVCKGQGVSGKMILKSVEKISLPADPVTNLFLKMVDRFVQELETSKT